MRRQALIALTLACAGDADRPTSPPKQPPTVSAFHDAASVDAVTTSLDPRGAASVDAASVDAAAHSLDTALAALRSQGYGAAADTITARIAQERPKMRLSPEEGRAAALALLELADRASFRTLVAVMPRSTVELARAVRERGVASDEAEAIARYLVQVVNALALERLHVFDENHSHVTGRDWHEIDYSSENMTWEGQRDDWVPRGVKSFKRAQFIHAYFIGAERLPHWKRVYRPRGRMVAVTPP